MRYLTKQWYLDCQAASITPDAQKKLDDTMREKFRFHDGVIKKILCDSDCTLWISSPFSSYHSVVFQDAVCRQSPPPVGAVWLYAELYRHKSGRGFEAHVLFSAPQKPVHKKVLPSDLIEWKVVCSNIVFA